MDWKSVDDELPPIYEEVLVWIDGHRGAAWSNNYALVAYRTKSNGWFEERHPRRDAVVGVTHWARFDPPKAS